MSSRDHLLIGEFLRRHHARLAHQIAVSGFPGPEKERLRLQITDPDLADLAGAVARSHGLPLRVMVDYVRNRHRLPVSHGVHAVYLMALLRVADYIQIHSGRAPRQYRMAYRMESPESRQEWEAHAAVTEISGIHDDPEALYVEARPTTLVTFLRVRRWLSGIQAELDLSWAVLGEVFGRFTREKLHHLGLTLRWVRSNLEQADDRPGLFSFIAREARFVAADAELLDLLVIPLYGNRPEVGIRELCQNAVDAVRERREYERRNSALAAPAAAAEPGVRITIAEEKGGYTLTVQDAGIGMTPEVVIRYFLRAGASFRRSGAWRQMFEDNAGHSRVLRLGRFGIGGLAGFLLGPRIDVSTRYVSEDEGVEFSAGLEDEVIEMRRTSGCAVGTTITIPLSAATGQMLMNQPERWDWYHLEEPRLVRRIVREGKAAEVNNGPLLPSPGTSLPPEWRRMQVPGLGEVHWSHRRAPYLSCNGIHVTLNRPRSNDPPMDAFAQVKVWEGGPAFVAPNLSIFDADGRLPLTLQRDALAEPLPFIHELIDGVLRDFVAFLLVQAPQGPGYDPAWFGRYQSARYSGLDTGSSTAAATHPMALWFSSPAGVAPLTPWHFVRAAPRDVVILTHADRRTEFPSLRLSRPTCAVLAPLPEVYDTLVEFLGRLSGELHRAFRQPVNEILECFPLAGARLFIPVVFLERGDRAHAWLTIRKRATVELRTRDWVVWLFGDAPDAMIDYVRLAYEAPRVDADLRGAWSGIVAEWYYASEPAAPIIPPASSVLAIASRPVRPLNSRFVDRWIELTGIEVIPFDADDRRRALAHAFDALAGDVDVQDQHPLPAAADNGPQAPRYYTPTIHQLVSWKVAGLGMPAERLRLEHLVDPAGRLTRSFRVRAGETSLHLKLAREPEACEALRQFWAVRDVLYERYHAPRARGWVQTPEPEYSGVLSEWLDGEVPWAVSGLLAHEVVLCVDRLHRDPDVAAGLAAPEEAATCGEVYRRTFHARFVHRLERIAASPPPFVSARLQAWLRAEATALEAAVSAEPAFAHPADAPTHGNLSPGNLLIVKGDALRGNSLALQSESWYLVDWHALALGDPALDWAMLFGPHVEGAPPDVHGAPGISSRKVAEEKAHLDEQRLNVVIERQLPPPVTADPGVRARLPLYARATLLGLVVIRVLGLSHSVA